MRAKRFTFSVINTAQTQEFGMPWTRGKHRSDFVAARSASQLTSNQADCQPSFA